MSRVSLTQHRIISHHVHIKQSEGRWRRPNLNQKIEINYMNKISIYDEEASSIYDLRHDFITMSTMNPLSSLIDRVSFTIRILLCYAPSLGWTAHSLPLDVPLASCIAFVTGLQIWRTLNPLKFPEQVRKHWPQTSII